MFQRKNPKEVFFFYTQIQFITLTILKYLPPFYSSFWLQILKIKLDIHHLFEQKVLEEKYTGKWFLTKNIWKKHLVKSHEERILRENGFWILTWNKELRGLKSVKKLDAHS